MTASYELGPFADDPESFVTAVFGIQRFRLAATHEPVGSDEVELGLLTREPRPPLRLLSLSDDMLGRERSPRVCATAAEAAITARQTFLNRSAELGSEQDAASQALEKAQDAIRTAEHDLVEARHRLACCERERENAVSTYRLALTDIAAFGKRGD